MFRRVLQIQEQDLPIKSPAKQQGQDQVRRLFSGGGGRSGSG